MMTSNRFVEKIKASITIKRQVEPILAVLFYKIYEYYASNEQMNLDLFMPMLSLEQQLYIQTVIFKDIHYEHHTDFKDQDIDDYISVLSEYEKVKEMRQLSQEIDTPESDKLYQRDEIVRVLKNKKEDSI